MRKITPLPVKVLGTPAKRILSKQESPTLTATINKYEVIEVAGPNHLLATIPGAYFDIYHNQRNKVEMPLCPASIDNLIRALPQTEFSPSLKFWADMEAQRRGIMALALDNPPRIPGLYTHQNVGVEFILKTGLWYDGRIRCLVADDMRLGKTVQAITALKQKLVDDVLPALILCPKSLCQYWAEQVALWGPACEIEILSGSVSERMETLHWKSRANNRIIFITNPEFIREAHTRHKAGATFNRLKTLVIDECHSIRNTHSQLHKAVKKVRTDNLILLTATPVEQGPQDYYSYVSLLNPGAYRSYWRFAQMFCDVRRGPFGTEVSGSKNMDLMFNLFFPMILRREAHNTVSIPEKVFEKITVPISKKFDSMYARLRKEFVIEISDLDYIDMPNTLSRLTRLRQFSAHPPALGFDDIDSPKLEALIDLCKNVYTYQSLVVYCSFRDVIEYIYDGLEANGISCGVYEGDASTIDDFNAEEFQVFLSTPQMGVGINLSVSSVIIYYDLPWPSTVLRQSMERTTTMYKQEPQMIISLVASDIDQVVADTLTRKQLLIDDSDICLEIEKKFT